MATINTTYKSWFNELKQHIHSSQIKAALKVNAELLGLYWHLGQQILDKEKNAPWGKKIIDQLSKDLSHEFPNVRGFSRSNLYAIKQWVSFYTRNSSIVQSHFGQLSYFGKSADNHSIKEQTESILNSL